MIVVIVLARAQAEIAVKLVDLACLGGRYIALTPRLSLGVVMVPLAAGMVAVLLVLAGLPSAGYRRGKEGHRARTLVAGDVAPSALAGASYPLYEPAVLSLV